MKCSVRNVIENLAPGKLILIPNAHIKIKIASVHNKCLTSRCWRQWRVTSRKIKIVFSDLWIKKFGKQNSVAENSSKVVGTGRVIARWLDRPPPRGQEHRQGQAKVAWGRRSSKPE